MAENIVIERSGRAWAVKHNASFIGFAQSREQAALVAQDLAEWMAERGRETLLILPDTQRSFAPRAPQSPSTPLAAATALASTSDA